MTRLSFAAVAVCALLVAGCTGRASVEGLPGSSDPASNNGRQDASSGLNNGAPDPFPEIPCVGIACESPVPTVTPRLTRLTHHQWENTVRDLLYLPDRPGLSRAFILDTLGLGAFDRMADSLSVTPPLWDDYREAAETLAAQVTSDPAALDRLLPPGAPTEHDARVVALIETFGARAYRRPLADSEVQQYVMLAAQAANLFGGGQSFDKSAEIVIRTILQSPHFLYRVELNTAETQYAPLNSYERASRLSYALWNTMPDDKLMAAAAAGELDSYDGVMTNARWMLGDERARDVIADFHAQLLGFHHFREMQKAAEVFPSFNSETPRKMEEESERFVLDVVFDTDGTYRDLMTAGHSFVDEELAAIYDIAPPAEEFGRVDLDSNQRRGVLTRTAFLALNANAYDPNPIHRGVFINARMLCADLPQPPDDFTIPDGVMGNTNRERIDNATRECGGACHAALINPPGFAFENYDALGAWRSEDGGYPVDATGELFFDGATQRWENGDDLVDLLANSPQAHACYVRNWFEYVNGRLPAEGDQPLIARLGEASHSGNTTVKELLVAMVSSDVFLMRDTGGAP